MTPPDRVEEFVFLLARHERGLAGYVLAMAPQPHDADDILQEAKVVMWRNFSQFQPGTNFAAWARKIAFHQVLAHRKRRKRDRLDFSEQFLEAVSEETERNADALEARQAALRACVEKLPKEHREAVHLRYQEGASLEAMAEKTSRTVCALYRQLSRVRQLLHECVTRAMQTAQNPSL